MIVMKNKFLTSLLFLISSFVACAYTPSPEVMKSREEFSNDRFGIFLHWGIYSLFGQGEWYLNSGVNGDEYKKAAKAFYPIDFNAAEWVKAIKEAGA